MFSTLTERGADGDARRAGARGERLRHQAGKRRQRRRLRMQLHPRAADPEDQGAVQPRRPPRPAPAPARRCRCGRRPPSARHGRRAGVEVVAIGGSTGRAERPGRAVRAAAGRLARAGPDRAAHAADVHAAAGRAARRPVGNCRSREARPADATVEPGQAWIAPGDYHMTVVARRAAGCGCARTRGRRRTPAGPRSTCSSARSAERSAPAPWPWC